MLLRMTSTMTPKKRKAKKTRANFSSIEISIGIAVAEGGMVPEGPAADGQFFASAMEVEVEDMKKAHVVVGENDLAYHRYHQGSGRLRELGGGGRKSSGRSQRAYQ